MRFGVYLRVSTAEQAKPGHVSLDTQEAACREAVQRSGHEVVAVLRDVQSGLENDRPQYLRLLELAAGRQIDAIMVYRLDRLGRDAAELLRAFKELRRYGVRVESATEPVENQLLAGILALLAEEESRRIGQRVRDALAHRVREGKWANRPPLGYDLVKAQGGGHMLQPNNDAPKVERLFELYATGQASLRSLREESALLGLGGPHGLSRNYLRRLLKNPAYVGKAVSRRRVRVDGVEHEQPPDRWIVAEGLHEPIVSQAVFDRVQEVLARHREAWGQVAQAARGRYLLTGLLVCGVCGRHMSRRRAYYRCNGGVERNGCQQPQVPARIVEEQVRDAITAAARFSPELLNEADERRQREPREGQLQRALRQREQERKRLALEFVRGRVVEEVYRALDSDLAAAASRIRDQLAQPAQREDGPRPGGWGDLDREAWITVLNALVDRVVVTGPAIEIRWADDSQSARVTRDFSLRCLP